MQKTILNRKSRDKSRTIIIFLRRVIKKYLLSEVRESAQGYIINQTKINETFRSWDALLHWDQMDILERMDATWIYAEQFLK